MFQDSSSISLLLNQLNPVLGSNSKSYILQPSKLVEYLINKKIKYVHKKIKFWDLFEKGKKYYSYDELMDLFYYEIDHSASLSLVTDEGIKKNIFFTIPSKDFFFEFLREYEDYYNMDFFQIADYIAFFPNEEKLNLIYHEGDFFSFDLK